MKKSFTYETIIGWIKITDEDDIITGINYNCSIDDSIIEETLLIRKTYLELLEYFGGKRTTFTVPIKTSGTEFQEKVWKELRSIPYGETRSYLDIAIMVGNAKACRAVGMANHNNPIAIIIPCHRVIGKNKKLTGYAGGLQIKEKLLKIETM